MKRHTSNTGDIGKRYRWFLTCFLASVVLLFIAMSGRASAAIIVVNTLADPGVAGQCTLRKAIGNANADGGAGTSADCAAGSGADTITFSVTGTITLGSTLPIIDDADGLTIDGGSQVAISGANLFLVFVVNSGAALTLENLTLKDGNNSTGFGSGGGIASDGTVTITNSTLSGNSSDADAGGIFTAGTLTIINSTLSGNSAAGGGGIFNVGTLTITNSTLSGNSATVEGGGILNIGTVTITNSTLVGNLAPSGTGGGIVNTGAFAIQNSILENLLSGNCKNSGTFTFAADSSDLATDNTCPGFTQVTSTDLNLGSLGDNGGPTQTHALLSPSVAIGAGDNTVCPATDQRGVLRDTHCDVGSYEFVPPPPPAQADLSIANSAAKTAQTGKGLTYTIQVINNGPNSASGVVVNDALLTGTTFVSVSAPGASNCITPLVGSSGVVRCSYSALANGSSLNLLIAVKVTAKGNGQISNTATVSSATLDPSLANNSATATTKLGK